ncbi:MAG: PKD domain protein, partial [Prevotella sp.]|nr:PKD domain protein [Prevotella sp.]
MFRLLSIVLLLLLCSCHSEQTTEVTIDVAFHIRDDNHTTPLTVVIENNTKHAGNFQWTFEGGEPATSTRKDP